MSVQSFKFHVFFVFFFDFLCFSTTSILYPLQALWQSPAGGKENVLSTFYLYFYLITCTLNIFLSSGWYPKCTNSGWKDKWLAPIWFPKGDPSHSGGYATTEAANLHPTTEERIERFGGSTEVTLSLIHIWRCRRRLRCRSRWSPYH